MRLLSAVYLSINKIVNHLGTWCRNGHQDEKCNDKCVVILGEMEMQQLLNMKQKNANIVNRKSKKYSAYMT